MGALDQLYQQLILEHSKAPHGKPLKADYGGESFQVNTTCGDQVRLHVTLGPGDVLEDVSWEGSGCSISQASLSVMTDLVRGKTLEEAATLSADFTELMHTRGQGFDDDAAADALGDAMAFEGVSQFPMRVKCALLGWMALKDAAAKAKAGDHTPAQIPEGWE
ncbi:MAG: SUF system NifU family Fe-S cluster assembly protein [Bifidobacteriaceae bacterium]|jgi:nitrogen fixation NifU-like protein|nr:SUF system NifU family Fe-S cluster assembly protein [Bifidobacteriaceae bacterium]